MVIIRLQRVGRKNHAEFRIVATESTRAPQSADYIELLGSYNPHKNEVVVDAEKVTHWISKGAQVSDTMHNILVSEKIIEGKKKNVLPKKTPIIKEQEDKEEHKEATVEKTPAAQVEASTDTEESAVPDNAEEKA